jgi:hypothetical protein
MATVAATSRPEVASPGPIAVYRDEGPLGRALARVFGPLLRLPPLLVVLLGAAPVFALLAAEGEGASKAAVGGVLAWLLVLAGGSAGRAHRDRLAWAVPPSLRVVEYATLLWVGTLAGGSGVAAAFALLCVVAFRQYDLVYRLRYRGDVPPPWTATLSGGWEARLVVAYAAWLAGALTPVLYVVAGVLAVALFAESASGWIRFSRATRRMLFEDEELEEDGP